MSYEPLTARPTSPRNRPEGLRLPYRASAMDRPASALAEYPHRPDGFTPFVKADVFAHQTALQEPSDGPGSHLAGSGEGSWLLLASGRYQARGSAMNAGGGQSEGQPEDRLVVLQPTLQGQTRQLARQIGLSYLDAGAIQLYLEIEGDRVATPLRVGMTEASWKLAFARFFPAPRRGTHDPYARRESGKCGGGTWRHHGEVFDLVNGQQRRESLAATTARSFSEPATPDAGGVSGAASPSARPVHTDTSLERLPLPPLAVRTGLPIAARVAFVVAELALAQSFPLTHRSTSLPGATPRQASFARMVTSSIPNFREDDALKDVGSSRIGIANHHSLSTTPISNNLESSDDEGALTGKAERFDFGGRALGNLPTLSSSGRDHIGGSGDYGLVKPASSPSLSESSSDVSPALLGVDGQFETRDLRLRETPLSISPLGITVPDDGQGGSLRSGAMRRRAATGLPPLRQSLIAPTAIFAAREDPGPAEGCKYFLADAERQSASDRLRSFLFGAGSSASAVRNGQGRGNGYGEDERDRSTSLNTDAESFEHRSSYSARTSMSSLFSVPHETEWPMAHGSHVDLALARYGQLPASSGHSAKGSGSPESLDVPSPHNWRRDSSDQVRARSHDTALDLPSYQPMSPSSAWAGLEGRAQSPDALRKLCLAASDWQGGVFATDGQHLAQPAGEGNGDCDGDGEGEGASDAWLSQRASLPPLVSTAVTPTPRHTSLTDTADC
ncbi:uncharacterized protein PFL1_05139 [Pseudozyma flocculosa PF-1]|uniref:Uncharacterized protein n=2 Tax=Pseudozyma flocculosa TaxID=84751 RepID=A0A5C3F618_9BASI|nr:uncharacterized protein PFL1_05139 [Pseudozyma flocculosa PF-1]EPQ27216.1 hypothetical protein PFL1_05139 [Pseudozyma flocculosa PF-1]SPO39580.1 uncharacterized protein PSFLO_05061 [Pseudozyma flocculosa]